MVAETIIQLYKVRESGDFLTLSEEDDYYEFALRSPFSFGQFLSLVQVTCPGLNKFGLLKVMKYPGHHKVLIPLSHRNFTEAITEASQQEVSLQEDGHRPSLKICAWEKGSSPNVEFGIPNVSPSEARRLKPCLDSGNEFGNRLEKQSESDVRDGCSNLVSQVSGQAEIGSAKHSFVEVKSVRSAYNRQRGHHGSCQKMDVASAGNLRPKAVRRALARFVRHVNFDDGAHVYAGAPFVKIWRVRNDSNTAWPENSLIMAVGGESMIADLAPQKFPVPALKPGVEQNIEIPLVAPSAPGKYQGFYRFCSSDGKKFGQRLSCQIMVVDGSTTASESTSSATTTDESSGDDGDEVRLRRDLSSHGARNDAKRQTKQKRRRDKRKRKLEKKAKKLRKKLEKIDRKLWKIQQTEESLKSKKLTQSLIIDGEFPVAIPAAIDDVEKFVAAGSATGVDANEETIVEGFNSLHMNTSSANKNNSTNSTYKQLLSLGFQENQVRMAMAKNGEDIVECLKDLTK